MEGVIDGSFKLNFRDIRRAMIEYVEVRSNRKFSANELRNMRIVLFDKQGMPIPKSIAGEQFMLKAEIKFRSDFFVVESGPELYPPNSQAPTPQPQP